MLVGKGISEGIGLGKAVILEENRLKIEKQKIENISAEKQKIYDAVKEVESEIEKLINFPLTIKLILHLYFIASLASSVQVLHESLSHFQ